MMTNAEDIKHWREMMQINERNIYHYEKQMETLGPYTPPYVRAEHGRCIAERDRYKKLIEQAGAKV